jgi:hypothetical protein
VLGSAFAALSPEKINPKIKDMEYAVRGQLVINAMVRGEMGRQLSVGRGLPAVKGFVCSLASDTCHAFV